MSKATRIQRRQAGSRKGAMLVLVAVSIVILLAAAAFSVDIAYMHLVREELHIATDASAKAAVARLSSGGSETQAKQAAVTYATKNTVAGSPLAISTTNVEIGKVTYSSTGRWDFTAGATPLTAARVTVSMTDGSVSGPVQLFFGRLFGVNTFSPAANSTAAFVRNKICLCFDRSRSMTFDMSGTDDSFPMSASGWPYGMTTSVKSDSINKYIYPPCNNSRWANLSTAANSFLDVLASSTIGGVETKVALVTWGSSTNNGGGLNNYYYYQATRYNQYRTYPTTYTDCNFVTPSTDPNYASIRTAISTRNKYTMLGGTDMNSGLQAAVDLIRNSDDGLPYNKIIILFSDGEANVGDTTCTSATNNAMSNCILVHTIGLLNSGAGYNTMQTIANRTGGRAYLATDSASLQTAFEQLARTLPVILTE